MGGFCKQNSLEKPLPRHAANACDWNPSRREEPINTKYPHNSAAKKNMKNTARELIIVYCVLCRSVLAYALCRDIISQMVK